MKDEQDKSIKKTSKSGSTGFKMSLQGFNCYKVWILDLLQTVPIFHRTYEYSGKITFKVL